MQTLWITCHHSEWRIGGGSRICRRGYYDAKEELSQIKISVNAIDGLAEPKTLKLMGFVAEQPVVVLIDCGATHDFISSNLVEAPHMEISNTTEYGALIENEKILPGHEIC